MSAVDRCSPLNAALGCQAKMETMDNVKKYEDSVSGWVRLELEPHKEQLLQGKHAGIVTNDYLKTLYMGFYDIQETLSALELSQFLISNDAPRIKEVTDVRYYRYVATTYLQDMYILKERLNAYATKIKRVHNTLGRHHFVNYFVEPLFPQIKSCFQNIVDVRGFHVHQQRYTDDSFDDALVFRALSTNEIELSNIADLSVELLREEWSEKIEVNNSAVKKFLNYYFGCLFIVIQHEGELIE